MSKPSKYATEYLKNGLSVIPTTLDKRPTLAWAPYQSEKIPLSEVEKLFKGSKGIGIITGEISGNLEVIDIDSKYDLTGSLWEDFTELLKDQLAETYSSLVIASTPSGGYHIFYRAPEVAGNSKLASRPANPEEAQSGERVKVLLETRGEGGYVVAYPTPGYTFIQGTPLEIPTIKKEERSTILAIAQSFNELVEKEPQITPEKADLPRSNGSTPLDDYNDRGDVLGLLQEHGYKITRDTPKKAFIRRPGDTKAEYSGNFHKELRTLRIFSSSTEFNPDKAYSPSQVYALLKTGGDYKKATRELSELGYGAPFKPTPRIRTEQIKIDVVDKTSGDIKPVSNPGDSVDFLKIDDSKGDIVITSPGEEAREEVIRAISELSSAGKRIYVKENSEETRSYTYQLESILQRYGTIQEEEGGLSDRQRDYFLEEIVAVGAPLDPIDKDIFRESFLSLEAVKALGITKQSLDIALDRLTATRDRETQRAYVDQILQKASDLQKAGDTKGALELLSARSKEAETLDKTGEFKKLLAPYTEDKVKSTLAGAKDSLDTGYTIQGDKLELPSGALSIFSAPTSHGKTSLLINLLLQVAKISPEKEFYLFSYEESGEVILLKTLNTFLDIELGKWNRRTLQSYFKTGEDTYIKPGERKQFYAKKEQFFTELIDTKRVNIIGSSFNSDTLIEAIRFLNKEVNLGGVFIDYFQLLNLSEERIGNYGSSRQTELKEICINLKDLAVETGLPITLGAQFNREVTSPRKIHPTRIGEAGDIERIANLLIGFWNTAFKPALDGKDSELTNVKTELGLDLGVPGTLFLEVMKNRDGVAGIKDTLLFNGNTGKISNRAPDIDLF